MITSYVVTKFVMSGINMLRNLVSTYGAKKIRKLRIKLNGGKLNKLGPIRMYPRDVTRVCGKNVSYYADQKCQLSTAEMNSHRVADMLGNFY